MQLAPEKDSKKDQKVVTRRFPEEEDEDILRETNDRFVLFPIKYHEVGRDSDDEVRG